MAERYDRYHTMGLPDFRLFQTESKLEFKDTLEDWEATEQIF